MKILYHHRTQMDDAQGIHIMEMIKAFKLLGHEVKLFSLVKKDERTNEKKNGKFWNILSRVVPNFIYELMEISYNGFAYLKIKSIVRVFKPDFIYERYSMYNFCGVLAAKNLKIPIILEVNAPLYYEQNKYEKLTFKRLAKKTENWICNNSFKTIVVTSSLKDILTRQGVNSQNQVVMSNGINTDDFNVKNNYEDIRSLFGIKEKDIVIGVTGWFREWHGLDFLIKACYENNMFNNSNAFLFFVGDGPSVPECKKLIKELDVEKFIKFTGAVARDQIPAYVKAIDIALQPKVTAYASPMKILEYMALSKAIVAPDQQNIRDILIHGENALLFEPGNRKELIKQIDLLVKNKELFLKISRGALQTIEKRKLYWTENAKRVITLIQASNWS